MKKKYISTYLLIIALVGFGILHPTKCPVHFNRITPAVSLGATVCADVADPDYQITPARYWMSSACSAKEAVTFWKCQCRQGQQPIYQWWKPTKTRAEACQPCDATDSDDLWCKVKGHR